MTRLIDVHRHLWNPGWFPPSHLRQTAEGNARATGRSVDDVLERIKRAKSMESTGTGAIEEMEHYGIDVSIILALDWGYAYGPEEDSEVPVEAFNQATMDVCKQYPGRLYAMCGYDPRRPAVVRLFKQAVRDWGAVGMKVYPPCGFQPNEEMCFPIYRAAIELDVPVLIHTGGAPNSRWTWPEWVEEVAIKFPELRILLGHTNLQSPFETGAYWRGLQVATRHPNMFLDLCDWQALGAVKDENIPQLLRFLRVALDQVGPQRICWGTDLPQAGLSSKQRHETEVWTDLVKNLPEWGEKHGIRFTEAERDGICFQAAERVFRNIFKQ
jgi:predicted TIM-barrel fold metal-dependent hydrolase